MKKNKLLVTTFAMLSSVALLVACGENEDGPDVPPAPPIEYTLTVAQNTLALNLFETGEIVTIAMQDGELVENAEIEWSSSDTDVVIVVDGIVEPVDYGSSEVTATWQGQTATCSVTVADNGMIPALNVDETDTGLQLLATSEPFKVHASVFYKDSTYDTSSATFTYTIAESEQSVARVDAQGYVTPVGVGTATLTVSAKWKGFSGSGMQKNVAITVVNDIQTLISGGAEELHLFNGTIGTQTYSSTTTFTANVQYNGAPVSTGIAWHSTVPAVASVEGGLVTALTEGETQVYYTYDDNGEVYESQKMTVKVLPVEVALTESLGEIVLIEDSTAVTANYAFDVDGIAEDASTVTKAVTATGEELRASYDNTNKQLTIYNDKIDGTADDYLQGVIGLQDGGEQSLTIYTAEGVAYTANVTIVSRKITTADGLNAFFASYKDATTEELGTSLTAGTYTVLGDNITLSSTYGSIHRPSGATYYSGVFDGRGHFVSFAVDSEDKGVTKGFFGDRISGNAVIKNTAFLNIPKNTGAGGGLARILYGDIVIDNCYVEIDMEGTTGYNCGIAYKGQDATITNTIVNVTTSEATETTKKATFCYDGGAGIDFNTCFSIGVENKVMYSVAKNETTTNVAFNANALKTAIETASGATNTLPASYNSYWALTTSGLSFGGTTVIEFTTTQG